MEELWKPYARLNGYAEISNKARVKNPKTGRILKQFNNKSTGYLCLGVKPNGREGKCICIRVHRAFAETWIPNPDRLPCVNHKDGVKTNNTFENLEWCTASQNIRHSFEKLNRKKSRAWLGITGENNPKSKKVINTLTGEIYCSIKDCSEKNNVKRKTLNNMLSGQRKNTTNFVYET